MTVLGHLKRGFLEKGEQVSVQTESDYGLRLAKFIVRLCLHAYLLSLLEESPLEVT